ncbi:hypothetical protein [Spiroplasma cantharicola]|uniref:Transmembrane protein n=1 Tax=Spiroplasma cantharicola TaxID=362837 RepID=A0A0M3SJH0_9MOLU|nr:hypothetical protein [Spiroplasma cantharicola]ALD66738.1 hypothetical protein SCANT_v1c08320 [Spiroplasma cantharicola]
MLCIKQKPKKSIFYLIISLIITLLSLFCLIISVKFLVTNNLNISNLLLQFGLFIIGFLLSIIYLWKLVNYIDTINYLKKIKLDQINKELFNNLIKKMKLELNPKTYLVIAISISMIFVYIFSQDNITRNLEISKFIYINRMVLLIISFSTFEFISVIFIFIILKYIRCTKFKWSYIKKISHNLYLTFLNLISFISIKFHQLKNGLLIFYVNITKKLNIYDTDQKNIISVKKRSFLTEKLKGDCPPNFII